MASHHFVGKGLFSDRLASAIREPEEVAARVADLVHETGFRVVEATSASFEGGGLTLVWILAESHLVLHTWPEQGYATLDLHVCDYHRSNAERAAELIESLTALCFREGSASWRELHLADPPRDRVADAVAVP